ncbi:glycerol-3-phosphate phosphatase-like [Mizuhopecten yessoensis]|uniref:glycerol-3-phosphate phosphatase-like n=1 Tax=Mizuhopecten yessoensis TaxID=6573 RepID=UPI000B45AC27|nr:glycerol-3-phosphate phosphatase-like [Mizuhopecten yessoensis]
MGVISKSTKLILQQGTRLFLSPIAISLPFSSSRSNMACNPVTEASARQLLSDVDNFVFDCDGVLWDGLTAIEGSPETLKRLKKLVDCVLVGFDPHLSLNKMVKGASYARREGSLFLATNEDSHLPLRSEVTIPGTGSIVAAVKVPARREPIVIGKPNPTIFNVLKEAHGLDPSRTLMVGDRCNTDIALAKNCGLHSLLVLSGVVSQEDVDRDKVSSDPAITCNLPDHVANCLWEFGKHIPDAL